MLSLRSGNDAVMLAGDRIGAKPAVSLLSRSIMCEIQKPGVLPDLYHKGCVSRLLRSGVPLWWRGCGRTTPDDPITQMDRVLPLAFVLCLCLTPLPIGLLILRLGGPLFDRCRCCCSDQWMPDVVH